MTGFDFKATAAWIRSRPASVQALIRTFPPGCVVEATRVLQVPRPSGLAAVISYTEDGSISVAHVDEDGPRAFCDPVWLRVVSYGILKPEDVTAILAGPAADAMTEARIRRREGLTA